MVAWWNHPTKGTGMFRVHNKVVNVLCFQQRKRGFVALLRTVWTQKEEKVTIEVLGAPKRDL